MRKVLVPVVLGSFPGALWGVQASASTRKAISMWQKLTTVACRNLDRAPVPTPDYLVSKPVVPGGAVGHK